MEIKKKNLLFSMLIIFFGHISHSAMADQASCLNNNLTSLPLSHNTASAFSQMEKLKQVLHVVDWYGKCDELDTYLTSFMAYHLNATTTYTFYEIIDQMFGPWGKAGYPIGYGLRYNILFTQNKKLMSNAYTKEWVKETTLNLQLFIKNYLIDRCLKENLHQMTEPELRRAAFNSHPTAYTQAGLDEVLIMAPELLWTISTIPGREFKPTSENFSATVKQVLLTVGITTKQIGTATIIYSTLPAHHGGISRARSKDYENYRRMLLNPVMRGLNNLEQLVKNGSLDSVGNLNELTRQLWEMQYENESQRSKAVKIIALIGQRMRIVQLKHSEDIRLGEVPANYYDIVDPDWQ